MRRVWLRITHYAALITSPMFTLDPTVLRDYRAHTFRLRPAHRLRSTSDAREFVAARGFVYFWPINGATLPSLWAAVAGDRPVADAHDDPGHVTWGWKDESLDKRWWYYAKILRGRATLLALEVAPYFYALSENYGEPEQDYLDQYRDGLLSQEAKTIYETLLEHGPLDTVNLRRAIRMTSQTSNSPFERGLTYLQRDFKILPIGVAQTGAWRYSFIYETVHRWYPDLPAQARAISRRVAREKLVELYVQSLGAVAFADVRTLCQWPRPDITTTLASLVQRQALAPAKLAGDKAEWFVGPGINDQLSVTNVQLP